MSATNNSVDRALAVLQFVARAARPVKFTDLVAATSIPKGTLHSLLASLESARFLSRGQAGYEVGIGAFEVGTAMPVASSLRAAVAPILDALADETGEACHFGTLVGTDVVYLDRRDTGEGLRFASRIGKRLPAHATSLGKAMLALLPDEDLRALYPAGLSKLTPMTLTTRNTCSRSLPRCEQPATQSRARSRPRGCAASEWRSRRAMDLSACRSRSPCSGRPSMFFLGISLRWHRQSRASERLPARSAGSNQ